jgi:hypothetical protein
MLETHRALPTFGAVVKLALDNALPGHSQTGAADARTLMALHHGDVLDPFAVAEVAQDVAHIDIIGICLWLSHFDNLTQTSPGPGTTHKKKALDDGSRRGPRRKR